MNDNEQVIHRFYSAFQKRDYKTMQDCYSDDAIFYDTVFGLLSADELKAMWEMLCKQAKDFSLEYSNVKLLDEEYATCNWTAKYTFSKTGRKIVNKIKAHMRIKGGKIIEHSDAFRLSEWAAQAFGLPGAIFGWMGFMKRKIRKTARKNLDAFMEKNAHGS
jgi:ketosteroid isomerase-like protein